MNNSRIKKLKERARETKSAAHKRVIKDGTIQFRLDAENMERLLTLADKKRTGAGVLARMWVLDRLNKELLPYIDSAEYLTQLQSQLNNLSKLMHEMISRQAKAS
jgi:hypothetical protein